MSNSEPLARHFAHKTMLITGATDGIGRALATQLAAWGARLILVGRRDPVYLADGLFGPDTYCRCDLANPDCGEVIAGWLAAHDIQRLDYVIHNAGLGYVGRLSAQSTTSVAEMLAVNVAAPIQLTHRVFPLVAAAAGCFVYLSSLAATLPVADYAVYGASKAALEGFVRNLQIELDAVNAPVRTQVLRIGPTRTAMHEKSGATRQRMNWDNFPSAERTAQAVLQQLARGASGGGRQWTQSTGAATLHAVGVRFPGLMTRLATRAVGKAAVESPAITVAETVAETVTETGTEVVPAGEANAKQTRHCVITGAAAGIGRALAFRFGAAGYTITGVDVDRAQAMQTQADLINRGIRARFVIADLARADQSSDILERLSERPPIDVLIQCAGISAVGHFPETAWAEQAKVLQINLVAPLQLTRDLLAAQRFAPGGTLVYISSLAHYTGYPGAAVYGGTKSGIARFAQALTPALGRAGLAVLTVFPGPVRTEHARRYSPDNSREQRRMAPERVADSIYDAVAVGKRFLLPGAAAPLFAALGSWFPRLTEWGMRRALFDKLRQQSTARP